MKGEVPEGYYTIPLGKADIKREGSDVTIVAIENKFIQHLRLLRQLSKKGLEVEVIDPRSLSPLDEDTILASVEKKIALLLLMKQTQDVVSQQILRQL